MKYDLSNSLDKQKAITAFKSHLEKGNKVELKKINYHKPIMAKYRKIPIVIMKYNDGVNSGWRAELADNYKNYKPANYDDINFEDLVFHFKHDIETHPNDDLLFLTRKSAVLCAKYCNDTYLDGKAKIWFIK